MLGKVSTTEPYSQPFILFLFPLRQVFLMVQMQSSLYNKIRNKGKIVSAGYWGGDREGAEWVVREEVGAGGRNEPSLVCTYE
jgi:hypothetical protein